MGDFMIDGIDMPKPSEWKTVDNVLTKDAQRLPGNGRLVAPYAGMVKETVWRYKYLEGVDYDKLYDAYVTSCARNKSIEHTLTTIDSNTGNVISYIMYTENRNDRPLYRIENGVRVYKDIEFTFVGVGGDA